MKSDGCSSETKMPVHLVESLTAMGEAAEKSEQRRIKPNKASRSRKSENNATNISNHCAELLRPTIVFPSNLFFLPSWDLTHFALRVQRLKIEARMESMVNSLCLRIRPADFVDAIDNKLSTLQSTPLSKTWPLIRFNNKMQLPPWMKTLQQLKNSPNEHTFGVTCITHFPLETWKSMTKDKIRSCLPAPAGPLKMFKAAKNRCCKFKAALEQFSQQQVLENVKRTHHYCFEV